MAIRIKSEVVDNSVFEKEVFAVGVDGKVSEVVVRLDAFTIVQKEQKIERIDAQILELNTQKKELQSDIDAAEAL